ncbi:hypothetical protein [Streptomyces sp. S.PB5]|uniref:hypothetical protein n=1 Tax=Streptomyces sp. S.PB5 TaxID=3020844 RepID=UPI0025B1B73A|nr:hypothetical protein [Streptomyces sp. S.PB5]MDN3020579.1 hypothetical protein [Streptomyces sp. S.PB5]
MSADRETNHDMANRDISVLLAAATDEVEIGTAPYQEVVRGGRRRRTRRWAVAAATALVLAGSSATLAVAGLPGGGETVAPAATQSATPTADLFAPARTTLATGEENGKEWRVVIDVWDAPRNEVQAAGQFEAMGEYGDVPSGVTEAAELIGKSTYQVRYSDGSEGTMVFGDDFMKGDDASGTDIQAAAIPTEISSKGDPSAPASTGPERLVIGQVSKYAQQVTCTWKDGTMTRVDRAPSNAEISTDELSIRPAEGSPVDWFVCLAPKGTAYKSVEVSAVE